jgi:comEA protein
MNSAVSLLRRKIFFLCALVALLWLGFSSAALAGKKPPLKPVNINTATEAELQQVPGIGPVTAKNIVQMRKSYGQFKSVDDLLAVRGIGRKRLDKMRKFLTVGKPPGTTKTAPPAKGKGAGSGKTAPPAAPKNGPPGK